MKTQQHLKVRPFGSYTHCDRCGSEATVKTGSFFNVQMICLNCCTEEREHYLYPKARKKEEEEVKKGNFNFEGIGLPKDLVRERK